MKEKLIKINEQGCAVISDKKNPQIWKWKSRFIFMEEAKLENMTEGRFLE